LRYEPSLGRLENSSSLARVNFTVTSTAKQKILGFGGAMTDSSAIMINQMDENIQNDILATYFDPIIGNGYTLIRTNMGACDFSERNYTYLDEENDFELNSWALATEDVDLKIPMYKKINQIVKNAIPDGSRDIQYYFAPWSAPKWMKTNNDFAGQGKIIEDPKYYKTWAEYFIKFIQAYRAEGLNFQHFSLQNEPLAGMYTSHEWQETGWNATGENEFLINYIIPELIKNGIDDVNVQVMDAQRPFFS